MRNKTIYLGGYQAVLKR